MKEIKELLNTIAEAKDYIEKQLEADNASSAAFLADDINTALDFIAEKLELSGEHLPPLGASEMFEENTALLEWLNQLSHWTEQIKESKPTVVPTQKIQNETDREFYTFINGIGKSTYDKILSRIKRAFQKLPVAHQANLSNYVNTFTFWGSLHPQQHDYQLLKNKAKAFHEHWEDYLWLYERLEDYRSRFLLLAILKNSFQFDFEGLGLAKEVLYKDYFDLDLVQCTSEEVVVDLGAFIGDTVLDYISVYGSDCYKSIYCYEISDENFEKMEKNLASYNNIHCRKKGAGSSHCTMSIQTNAVNTSANTLSANIEEGASIVDIVPIDDDITEPVTLIKMDIEGAEQDALKGCIKHIQATHPKLLLSVYHNNEDLWKIPRMVEEICPGYQFYLRYHGGNLWATEITFLAIYPTA